MFEKARASASAPAPARRRPETSFHFWALAMLATIVFSSLAISVVTSAYYGGLALFSGRVSDVSRGAVQVEEHRQGILQRCQSLRLHPAGTRRDRPRSDRVHPQERESVDSILISNATIFTGDTVVRGDLWMEEGVVRAVGEPDEVQLRRHGRDVSVVVDARGAWLTPGLVNIYSHEGILGSPLTRNINELDSQKGPVLPYLRTIDGFHTFDERILRSITHGVTSAQVAAGKANLIGGEAFVLKLRKTWEGSPSSMVITDSDSDGGSASSGWRYLLQSCNEVTRRYGINRMDGVWSLRQAYNEARKVMRLQDSFCANVESGLVDLDPLESESQFPENFKWEMLVDVLRGKVKVFNVCGEAVDLDNMIRLSEEFHFNISAFLLASEAWLVPKLLRKVTQGGTTVGLPGNNYGYSRETYRGSQFSPRILNDNNVSVIMADDTPGTGYTIDEARKAYYFGLSEVKALESMTSIPATSLGLSHRIGVLRDNSDADIVLWDSHPLHPGASPIQVWIDGIPQRWSADLNGTIQEQLRDVHFQSAPSQPDFDEERKQAIKSEGLVSPFARNQTERKVVFTNVTQVWDRRRDGDIEKVYPTEGGDRPPVPGLVVVENGEIVCVGEPELCSSAARDAYHVISLHGGSVSPGLMTFGSRLGLQEFMDEPSADDGRLYNAFSFDVPRVLHDVGGIVRAVDGLMFGTRHALTAYHMGITSATSSLMHPLYPSRTENDGTVVWGLSTTFRTGALHALEPGAIMQEVAGLHVRITRASSFSGPHYGAISVSEQLAGLRRLLYGWESRESDTGKWFRRAAEGVIPLVVEVHNADVMASLVAMKADVDDRVGGQMRMVFSGASEAHLLAKELHQARVGVILTRMRPSYTEWEGRRILPGPPLSNETALGVLMEHDVVVGVGVEFPQLVANTLFSLREAVSELRGHVKEHDAYQLVSRNLERLLGVRGMDEQKGDLVAYDRGDIFEPGSKAVAILTASRGVVDLF
ncbi:carbohydrate esterase family 9 protein [Marasmius fiardii PR-910]|nr:carbohydrate esterase family 9 protein [Marasmius fiardii PR-910]